MKAMITGASSGLGYDMAKYLSQKGYDLVVVARRKKLLEQLKKEVPTKVEIMELDLSKKENCYLLEDKLQEVDILINNAGFGVFGEFTTTSLEKELNMLDVNVQAVHILTKLFLQTHQKGYLLNVASSAAFAPGPLMAGYYASKSYVYRLSLSVAEELKKQNSDLVISILCPGPVDTNFNNIAGVHFSTSSLQSPVVAKYAIDKMFAKKLVIVPGIKMKFAHVFSKLLPETLLSKITYHIQHAKRTKR